MTLAPLRPGRADVDHGHVAGVDRAGDDRVEREGELRTGEAAGLEQCTVDVNYGALLVPYHPPGRTPYVRIETIGGRTFNYGRLTEMLRVVERFRGGGLRVGGGDGGDRPHRGLRRPVPVVAHPARCRRRGR
jgi:hypothetical protein